METRDARRALLARLIDHAPTFPPAALSPAEALAEDARASGSRHAFVLATARVAGVAPRGAPARPACPERGARRAAAGGAARSRRSRPGSGGADLAAVEGVRRRDLRRAADRRRARGATGRARPPGAESEGPLRRGRDSARRGARALRPRVSRAQPRVQGDGGAAPGRSLERRPRLPEPARGGRIRRRGGTGSGRAGPGRVLARRGVVLLARPHGAGLRSSPVCAATLFHSIGSCSFFEPVEELEALGALPA